MDENTNDITSQFEVQFSNINILSVKFRVIYFHKFIIDFLLNHYYFFA